MVLPTLLTLLQILTNVKVLTIALRIQCALTPLAITSAYVMWALRGMDLLGAMVRCCSAIIYPAHYLPRN